MNLKATTENEKVILAHVLANASSELLERIDAEGKTIQGCWKYLTSYAKAKIAKKDRHGEKCVYVPPEEIFSEAMHYFEDEKEGAIYKSEEDLREEAEAKLTREQREAEAKRREEERIAAMTSEEREAYERELAERKEREAQEAEEERQREAARQEAERLKRERKEAAERKRKEKEEREAALRNQPSLFDLMG